MEAPELERIARLARLRLAEREKTALARDMETVLGLFRELDEAPAAPEPLHHAVELESVFREDQPRPCLEAAEALRNAAAVEEGFFRGPRMLPPTGRAGGGR